MKLLKRSSDPEEIHRSRVIRQTEKLLAIPPERELLMPKAKSAGLLMYRCRLGELQVLIVHPGGPFWAKKDAGSWFVPKGQIEPGENELAAAQREFQEETGVVPAGPFLDLGEITQKSGKRVRTWAFAGDCDPAAIISNTFSMEWPPKSGRMQSFPEIDRAEFVTAAQAREKLNPAEYEFVERLKIALHDEGSVGRDAKK